MNNTCVQHFSTTVLYRAPQSTIVTCTTMYIDLVVDFHYFYISIKYLWGSHNKRECWKKSKQANKWVRSPGYTWGHAFMFRLSLLTTWEKIRIICQFNQHSYYLSYNIIFKNHFQFSISAPEPTSQVSLVQKLDYCNYGPDIQKLFYLLYYPRNK